MKKAKKCKKLYKKYKREQKTIIFSLHCIKNKENFLKIKEKVIVIIVFLLRKGYSISTDSLILKGDFLCIKHGKVLI